MRRQQGKSGSEMPRTKSQSRFLVPGIWFLVLGISLLGVARGGDDKKSDTPRTLRVGIMGSSAGGHLASTLLTHFDAGHGDATDPVERLSSRPDLGILCYPVITMGPNTHMGSKNNLLGKEPDPDLVKLLSNELQVTRETPPCFIWHTWEDKAVKVENSLDFAAALQKAGVPFDLHVYQKGAHGLGLGKNLPWAQDCIFWLKAQGFVKTTAE